MGNFVVEFFYWVSKNLMRGGGGGGGCEGWQGFPYSIKRENEKFCCVRTFLSEG